MEGLDVTLPSEEKEMTVACDTVHIHLAPSHFPSMRGVCVSLRRCGAGVLGSPPAPCAASALDTAQKGSCLEKAICWTAGREEGGGGQLSL